MSNQNNNEDEKAIIALGKIFKIFALIAVILIIALFVYLFSNAEPKVSLEIKDWSLALISITSDLAI